MSVYYKRAVSKFDGRIDLRLLIDPVSNLPARTESEAKLYIRRWNDGRIGNSAWTHSLYLYDSVLQKTFDLENL